MMRKHGNIGELEIRLNLSLAFFLIAVGTAVITAYLLLPKSRDVLVFGAAVSGGLATLYSAFYIGKSLQVQVSRDKLHRSLELLSKINGIELGKVRSFIHEELDHEKIPPNQVYSTITKNAEWMKAVSILLNNLEDISIAIQKGYADEETIYMALCGLTPRLQQALEPYISERRRVIDSKGLFFEFEKMAVSWKSKKSVYTGETLEKLEWQQG